MGKFSNLYVPDKQLFIEGHLNDRLWGTPKSNLERNRLSNNGLRSGPVLTMENSICFISI